MNDLRAFEAASGLRYWCDAQPWVLQAGPYSNGRGALFVEGECKLTVNLVDLPLESFEFFGKLAEGGAHRGALIRLGAIDVVSEVPIPAGRDPHYALRYEFSRCGYDDHSGYHAFSVQCDQCRAIWEHTYVEQEMRARARDAVSRLKGARI